MAVLNIVPFDLAGKRPCLSAKSSMSRLTNAKMPFELRVKDFEIAMQDIYDFFYDVNLLFQQKGLPRLDDELRPAILFGMLSDMLTASLAKHSRSLTQNRYFNGHPDLIVAGIYPTTALKPVRMELRLKQLAKKAAPSIPTADAINGCACSFMT
jgi:hypothetical protein